ncbi:hypothetical protein CR513_34838, partial [Mucuna pruriens]
MDINSYIYFDIIPRDLLSPFIVIPLENSLESSRNGNIQQVGILYPIHNDDDNPFLDSHIDVEEKDVLTTKTYLEATSSSKN